MYNNIVELTKVLAKNSADPQINFDLGLEYEKIGQTASAAGFYLRAAEYGYKTHKDLTYTAILKVGLCIEQQSQRDFSCSNNFLQAIQYMPDRPEAYYFLGRFYERNQSWQESYTNYSLALTYSDKGIISKHLDYDGKVSIEIGKAVSGYYVGRINESKEIFVSLLNNKSVPEKYYSYIIFNAKNLGIKLDKVAVVLPVRNNNSYRAERLKTCLSSWREQTEYLSDVHVIIDDDELDQFEFLKDYNFITVHVRPNMKLIPKINSVVPMLADIYEYLAFVGDDIIFRTPWESKVIEYLKSVPAGMAHTNTLDRPNVDQFGSHPIITSNMVRILGFYGCPAVDHTFFDNFWMDISNDIGNRKYFGDIIWDHARFGYEPDNMYWEIVTGQDINQQKYEEYKKTGYQQDLEKVRELIK